MSSLVAAKLMGNSCSPRQKNRPCHTFVHIVTFQMYYNATFYNTSELTMNPNAQLVNNLITHLRKNTLCAADCAEALPLESNVRIDATPAPP